MAYIVVDTDVVSYGFRQDSRFLDFYGPRLQGSVGVVSFMTLAELKFGALNRNWGAKRQANLVAYLHQNYVQYGVSDRLCQLWAELTNHAKQQGRVLNSADAWVAATAVAVGAPLMTHNQRDFAFLPGMSLITLSQQ